MARTDNAQVTHKELVDISQCYCAFALHTYRAQHLHITDNQRQRPPANGNGASKIISSRCKDIQSFGSPTPHSCTGDARVETRRAIAVAIGASAAAVVASVLAPQWYPAHPIRRELIHHKVHRLLLQVELCAPTCMHAARQSTVTPVRESDRAECLEALGHLVPRSSQNGASSRCNKTSPVVCVFQQTHGPRPALHSAGPAAIEPCTVQHAFRGHTTGQS